jgi:hypothetical protein
MQRILGATFAAGLVLSPAWAADSAPAKATGTDAANANAVAGFEELSKHLTETMTKDLGLSATQVLEVEGANQAAAHRIQDAAFKWKAGDWSSTKEFLRQAIQAFLERESSLRAILTPDQQARFQQQRGVRGAELQTRLMTMTLRLSERQSTGLSSLNLGTARRMQSALAPLRDPMTPPAQREQALQAARAVQKDKDRVLQREILDEHQWLAYKSQRKKLRELLREAWEERGAS